MSRDYSGDLVAASLLLREVTSALNHNQFGEAQKTLSMLIVCAARIVAWCEDEHERQTRLRPVPN